MSPCLCFRISSGDTRNTGVGNRREGTSTACRRWFLLVTGTGAGVRTRGESTASPMHWHSILGLGLGLSLTRKFVCLTEGIGCDDDIAKQVAVGNGAACAVLGWCVPRRPFRRACRLNDKYKVSIKTIAPGEEQGWNRRSKGSTKIAVSISSSARRTRRTCTR
jgi:hypothetical protein